MKTYASRLFDELNRKYWRGRLPRYRVIQRASLYGLLGLCKNKAKVILLAPHPSLEALRLTLLHEMCHIGTDSGISHGPLFLRKMRRLVRLGETKLFEGDIEHYDGTTMNRRIEALQAEGCLGPEIPFRDVVRGDIEAMAMSYSWQKTRWSIVERVLANSIEATVPQFRRACPWAEREWRRLMKESRELRRAEEAFRERRRAAREAVSAPSNV